MLTKVMFIQIAIYMAPDGHLKYDVIPFFKLDTEEKCERYAADMEQSDRKIFENAAGEDKFIGYGWKCKTVSLGSFQDFTSSFMRVDESDLQVQE